MRTVAEDVNGSIRMRRLRVLLFGTSARVTEPTAPYVYRLPVHLVRTDGGVL